MTNLKPCPFCGSEAELNSNGRFWHVSHAENNGRCPAWAGVHFETEAEAIEAWNTRADSEESEYYNGYEQLMNRCADLTTLLRDMFPLLNKDLLDKSDRDMLVSCNDRCIEFLGIDEVEHG